MFFDVPTPANLQRQAPFDQPVSSRPRNRSPVAVVIARAGVFAQVWLTNMAVTGHATNFVRAVLLLSSVGISQMTRLGMALGAKAEACMGLSGLVLTATSDLSRNRTVGLLLAHGKSLQQAVDLLTSKRQAALVQLLHAPPQPTQATRVLMGLPALPTRVSARAKPGKA